MANHFVSVTDWQSQALRQVKEDSGLTMNEILRRMLDHCFKPQTIGEIVPSMSGRRLQQTQTKG